MSNFVKIPISVNYFTFIFIAESCDRFFVTCICTNGGESTLVYADVYETEIEVEFDICIDDVCRTRMFSIEELFLSFSE